MTRKTGCGGPYGAATLTRMDRQTISALAHADHPIAGPLAPASVRELIAKAVRRGDERFLDLGCGGGAWLLSALADHPRVRADGVDLSAPALARAEEAAAALGVSDRLALHRSDAAAYEPAEPFDVVLCVGATHAFGGLLPTLAAARRHLAPGGRVIVGDGFWEHPPSPAAVEIFGAMEDLPATVDKATGDGWIPVYGHISTRQELDEYEWSWTGSLASWALDHPDDPDAAEALAVATAHRDGWLRAYRDAFGFVCLVLRSSAH
ncbi:SAM-dependent methyltransferase [Actinoallomurus iriomotensis]|uniref:SAM-dependent methyltransferase n=2 Tax=Actinoallomurus iriomotensis TaxID=478107 RepID=A0A9W6S416_9ACTN|nr:SAM-dependent methyltransferase [Actinoallomurus iriomotensis]